VATARKLVDATNEAHRNPLLNLQLARAYLAASDPAFVERTWQTVMDQMQARGKESSRSRFKFAYKHPAFDGLRHKPLMETTTADFFTVFKTNSAGTLHFAKRLHSFAANLGWLVMPIVTPKIWPKIKPKERRGITLAEHQQLWAKEQNAEWKLYLELLWETGAAQTDAANMKVEDIDWPTRTLIYFRQKTGARAQLTISKKLETVLNHLPTIGYLFPTLSKMRPTDRGAHFRYGVKQANLTGITLHSYRYAWAERANSAGMPERFAQAALGHNSTAIHRAYARKAIVIAPSLEDYENRAKPSPPSPSIPS
jgi:integrase